MAYQRVVTLQGVRETAPDLLTLSLGGQSSPEAVTVRSSELQRPLAPGEQILVVFGNDGKPMELLIGLDHQHRPECPRDCRRFVAWIVEP